MQLYDALENRWQTVKVNKDPECPVCGKNPTVTELIDYEEFCGVPANDHEDEDAVTDWEIMARASSSEIRDGSASSTCASRTSGRSAASRARSSSRWASCRSACSELDSAEEIVLHCKSGVRSMRRAGVPAPGRASASSRTSTAASTPTPAQVDPSIPTY